MPSSIGYIKGGQLRALGVTSVARSDALPEVATVAEFVPGYEASQWTGIGARGTRPLLSSTSSTRRSMRGSPIPG